MITHIRVGGRLPLKALALLVGVSVLSRGSAMADDNDPVVTNQVQTNPELYTGPQPYTGLHLFHGPESFGTLGYGPPGLQPGAQGFSLGYHPGYGYGRGAWASAPKAAIPSTGAPAIPTPGRACDESGESYLSPITAALAIPSPATPTTSESSAR